ncbi:YdcF family protein [Candidatus Woesearchaeota archaeon]|nr:YdcF family protein [Candidatus Woesearchaeota archaeon]
MQQKQCILVLGSGVTPQGDLTFMGKSRVEKGVELYKKGYAQRMLFCGGYSYTLKNTPAKTEAQAMKAYALSLGVAKDHIFLEEQSKDTLGNAYFAKQFLEHQNWMSFYVVTSNYHLPKTAYAFQKVFGREFSIEIIPCLTFLSADEVLERVDSEKEKIQMYKQVLGDILDGDDRAVQKKMMQFPWYTQLLKIAVIF